MELPSDEIEKICKKLDNKSLAQFMRSSSRIHQICYDVYSKRYLEEEEKQKEIISRLAYDKNVFHEIWWDNNSTFRNPDYPFESSFGSKSLCTFLESNSGKRIKEKPNYVYIPEIRTFGDPEIIKRYLKSRDLNNKSINELMKTKVSARYHEC